MCFLLDAYDVQINYKVNKPVPANLPESEASSISNIKRNIYKQAIYCIIFVLPF